MILDPSGTTTFPEFDNPDYAYTLDDAYYEAQYTLWSTYFGDLLAWALFACLAIPVYFYFINFPQDRRLIKMTVVTLLVFEMGATAFLTYAGYQTQIVNWGHSPTWFPAVWGSMLFDCSIASIVHSLYSWRIYKLIARRWLGLSLALSIMLISAAQFACCLTASMYAALQAQLPETTAIIARRFFHAWLVLATLADIAITTVMAIKLFSARTGVRSTDRAINKLLYVTIPGGAVTAVVTLAILVIQLEFTDSNHYQILVICLTKFYSNSVLVCLNLRASTVNGAGRHTMLTGFNTDDQVASSRLPFDVKVDRQVEKFTSSAMMGSSAFHSDPVTNSSDYGLAEESRTMAGIVDHRYPVSIHTMPLNIGPYRSRSSTKEKSTFAPVSEHSIDGHHPFQSSDNVNVVVETPKYLPSVHSTLSTKASRGHDVDEKQSSSIALALPDIKSAASNYEAKPCSHNMI